MVPGLALKMALDIEKIPDEPHVTLVGFDDPHSKIETELEELLREEHILYFKIYGPSEIKAYNSQNPESVGLFYGYCTDNFTSRFHYVQENCHNLNDKEHSHYSDHGAFKKMADSVTNPEVALEKIKSWFYDYYMKQFYAYFKPEMLIRLP